MWALRPFFAPGGKLVFPKVRFSVLLTRWDVDRSFLEVSVRSAPWLMSVWMVLYVFSAVGCNRCAPSLANEQHMRFCSFSLVQVHFLPATILSVVLPATSALFDNNWDPHSTILMRKCSFDTCARAFAGVYYGCVGLEMTICISVSKRPAGFMNTVP